MAQQADAAVLIAKAENILKAFVEAAAVETAVKTAVGGPEGADRDPSQQDEPACTTLAEARSLFEQALAMCPTGATGTRARAGVGRSKQLQEAERQRAKRARHLQICRQRYGANWKEAMLMDTQVGDEDLQEMFDLVDDDKSGYLDRDEVETLIDFFSCGDMGGHSHMTTPEDIDRAMAQMDTDNTGEVDFAKFKAWWHRHSGMRDSGHSSVVEASEPANEAQAPLEETKSKRLRRTKTSIDYMGTMRQLFRRYAEGSASEGEIDAPALQQIMRSLGHSISLEQADSMVSEIDEDRSGTIDFDEFINMVEGGAGNGLVDVLREASFSDFDRADRDMWARGIFLKFPSGDYRPIFSREAHEKALANGAIDTKVIS